MVLLLLAVIFVVVDVVDIVVAIKFSLKTICRVYKLKSHYIFFYHGLI